MEVVKALFFDKFPVGCLHASSTPSRAPAKSECHKLGLHLSLLRHVCLLKKVVDAIICKNFAVEYVNNLLNRVVLSQFIEESDSFLVNHSTRLQFDYQNLVNLD